MNIKFNQSFYKDGVPVYEAGKIYDLDESICKRMVSRSIAAVTKGSAKTEKPAAKKKTSKKSK